MYTQQKSLKPIDITCTWRIAIQVDFFRGA